VRQNQLSCSVGSEHPTWTEIDDDRQRAGVSHRFTPVAQGRGEIRAGSQRQIDDDRSFTPHEVMDASGSGLGATGHARSSMAQSGSKSRLRTTHDTSRRPGEYPKTA
jgi:hypothetical protein